IDQIASEAEEKGARAVTMEVTEEQAQEILLAANIDKLSLILGRPNESARDPNRRIGERDNRSDNPRAGAAGCASPARSRRTDTSAAIEPGEGDHRAKWGDAQ